jgi:hypothetical protein
MIPKIIWQTHEWEYEDLPIYFAKTSMTWINLNPEYRYVYVSGVERENFIKSEYPELYLYYKYWGKINKCYESDIWRYLVTNKRGGFYCDMDSVCIKPLNYALKNFKDSNQIITLDVIKASNINNYTPYNDFTHLNIDPNITTNNSNFGSIPNSMIMKDIVYRMKTDAKKIILNEKSKFSVMPTGLKKELPLFTPWDHFNLALSKNLDTRLIDNFAYHTEDFKKDFINKEIVDYYGEQIPYLDLIKREGVKEFYQNKSLKQIKKINLSRKNEYSRIFGQTSV